MGRHRGHADRRRHLPRQLNASTGEHDDPPPARLDQSSDTEAREPCLARNVDPVGKFGLRDLDATRMTTHVVDRVGRSTHRSVADEVVAAERPLIGAVDRDVLLSGGSFDVRHEAGIGGDRAARSLPNESTASSNPVARSVGTSNQMSGSPRPVAAKVESARRAPSVAIWSGVRPASSNVPVAPSRHDGSAARAGRRGTIPVSSLTADG